ncbi:pyridoxal-phosphate dependent enzyme [Streptomyces sp. BV333]|uniref:threonine ammonia-lyase n=1 Tax=Streptomyces sp. BV333 TaxID=2849673 RepID=UPI001C2DFBCE|nr:pyridoxal-phosphate dependent enzyme [Streptomyces sp. BV333]MBV1957409.1 pyridoxal-phosphate dependent enzyme [Streptomyces sp. BV333]
MGIGHAREHTYGHSGTSGPDGAEEGARLDRAAVERAGRRLADRVWRTPVLRCEPLDTRCGARLWLKAENLQRGGSFKVRGALLAVEHLAMSGSRGAIAQSTGNHAIAVALAARQYGLPAVVVLPTDAPPAKIHRVREAGAEVVTAGTLLADRVAAVSDLRGTLGYDVIDPYQNPHVVAGQGTATAELLDQAAEQGARLDAVVVPVGGGSAIAGACLTAEGREVAVVGAEPQAVPALTTALRADRPVTVTAGYTIADGLRPDRIGALPFTIARGAVAAVETVSEEAIAEAMRAAFLHARLVIEPAAAAALAAALEHASRLGTDVGVLLSGGNVEPSLAAALLTGQEVSAPDTAAV